MFNPKYRILITSKNFPKDKFICLGTQMTSLINSFKDYLPSTIWYAANVEGVGENAEKQNFNNMQISLIGTEMEFIEYCSGIEQFIWGVFLCVDKKYSSQEITGIELETEDKAFRSIDCNGILIEIRTFDTTYFEIYTEDLELMRKISKKYDVCIEKIK